jgi:ribose transport system substrate-binding protein
MSGPSNTRKRSTADTSRSRHRARSSVRWLGITAGVISALLIAACGSSSSSSTASSSAASSGSGTSTAASGTSTTSGSGTCDVAAINAQLAKYNGYPTFSPPGPPITVSKLKGRKIADIPLNSSIQFVNLIDQEMKTVSQSLGIGFNIATNQGQTNQWIQGMNQAVNAKAGAIILSQAPDPKVLQPQIIQAKSAGIPTISTHWYDTEDATDTPANVKAPNLAADVPFRFTTIARLEADWAIAHSNCKAHTIFIYASDSDGHKQMAHAYQQELTSKCGSGCSATLIGLPFSDWPTKLQSTLACSSPCQLSTHPVRAMAR